MHRFHALAAVLLFGLLLFSCSDSKTADFFQAIEEGESETVEALLEDVDVNVVDENGISALIIALRKGDAQMVQLLLDSGAEVNPEEGATPLHEAAGRADAGLVKALLDRGADANKALGNGMTALHRALRSPHPVPKVLEVVYMLIDAGADVHIENVGMKGFFPNMVSWAAAVGEYDLAAYLIDQGVSPFTESPSAFEAAVRTDDGRLAALLLDSGLDPQEAVLPAVKACAAGIMRLLIARGADVYAVHERKPILVYEAVQNGHVEMVEMLLNGGLSPDEVPDTYDAPIIRAVKNGSAEISSLLLQAGADPRRLVGNHKYSLLHTAVASSDTTLELIQALLEGGVPTDTLTGDKESVMALAAERALRNKDFRIVKYLASQGVAYAYTGAAAETAIGEQTAYVEGGEFIMGSASRASQKEHPVQLETFRIAKYELLGKQLAAVLNWGIENGKIITNYDYVMNIEGEPQQLVELGDKSWVNWDGTRFSVEEKYQNYPGGQISWYGAVALCNYLSEMDNLQPVYDLESFSWISGRNGYRLPTEAEWEYAARGGVKSGGYLYSGGDEPEFVARVAMSVKNGTIGGKIEHAARLRPSELGTYDMSGNVYEWCWDWESPYEETVLDNPRGPETGREKIIRGGCATLGPERATVYAREAKKPGQFHDFTGFRVVRNP